MTKENLLRSNKNVYHNGSLSGNYDGTFFNLAIQEEAPMNDNIIKAVKDYLAFEQETSLNYPFATKDPTEAQINAIAALFRDHSQLVKAVKAAEEAETKEYTEQLKDINSLVEFLWANRNLDGGAELAVKTRAKELLRLNMLMWFCI